MTTQTPEGPNYIGYDIKGYSTLEDHAREGFLTLWNVDPSRVDLLYLIGDKVIRVPMECVVSPHSIELLHHRPWMCDTQHKYHEERTASGVSDELLAALRSQFSDSI